MNNQNQQSDTSQLTETTNKSPQKKRSMALVILFVLSGTLLGLLGFNLLQKVSLAGQLFIAKQLISQGNCAQAVPMLHKIIYADPKNSEAYLQRATCYGSTPTNVFEERYRNLVNAIYDMDMVIALQPGVGDYYVDKELVFRELAEIVNDSASKFAFYELATQNCEKAIELGVSPGYTYVFRHHARNLIESNHCEEGLQETQALINQTPPQDPIMSTYNVYLTEAYICLGDFEKALESAQKIQCDDPVVTCRTGLIAEIYFQMDKKEEALELFNAMINQDPAYGGWRYFLRAAIFYEKGQKELALQDLAMGEAYTWTGNGVYWYVKSKMAFDEGDKENGLLYLQYAESTLDVQYSALRKQIQDELKDLGAKPLNLSPNLPPGITLIP
ncbi:MAG: tetratricopeptide repeat protein [Chloroflexota bacterium]